MATGKIVVNVLDVGQGQCTFVEIWDDDGMNPQLIETLLFDCGSNSQHSEDGIVSANLDYIASRVSSMTVPQFNAVFFSHGDTDHTNLMYTLLEKIRVILSGLNPPKTLNIGEVWYGGIYENYYKNGYNILTYIQTAGYCLKANIKHPSVDSTGVDQSTGDLQTYLWKSSDNAVKVFLLIGNVISDEPDDLGLATDIPATKSSEFLNRVSLVCLLRYANKDYIISGDATNRAMAFVNYFAKKTGFSNTAMLTLPHHGSRTTGFKNISTGNDRDTATVKTFAELVKGKTLTASAYHKHHHPSLELIELFTPSAEQKPIVKDKKLNDNSHYVVANIDRELRAPTGKSIAEAYATFGTQSNLYATYCFEDTPTFSLPKINNTTGKATTPVATIPAPPNSPAFNKHACWVYETLSNGTTTMLGCSSLPPTTSGGSPTVFTAPATGVLTLSSSLSSLLAEEPQLLPSKILCFTPAPIRPPAESRPFQAPVKIKTFR